MESLHEFNQRRRKEIDASFGNLGQPVKNGIACPQCGTELLDTNPRMVLTSSPPKKDVHCPACHFNSYRVA